MLLIKNNIEITTTNQDKVSAGKFNGSKLSNSNSIPEFCIKTKANGSYLSREFHKEINGRPGRNIFSIPTNLLRHSKQIKPKTKTRKPVFKSTSTYLFYVNLYNLFNIIFVIPSHHFNCPSCANPFQKNN